MNVGWTADRVAAELVRAEVNRSQWSKGPTKKESRRRSCCVVPREVAATEAVTLRREQSGSVGEGRLDGKGNSRRLAGHSTAVDKKF